jgi:hypothetical protein
LAWLTRLVLARTLVCGHESSHDLCVRPLCACACVCVCAWRVQERDNGETSIGCLRKICREKCVKLLYSTMGKIMTMVGSAAAAGIRHAPGALIDLVRLLRGGDVSDGNIWACNVRRHHLQ